MRQSIYITDDKPSVCEVLSTFLLRDGFAVETFNSGEALLAACERRVPDLIVLDIMMPKMDGLSACAALRSTLPRLPIILMSAKAGPKDCKAGLSAGGDLVLCKPFLPQQLAARIRTLLGQRRNTEEQAAERTDEDLEDPK